VDKPFDIKAWATRIIEGVGGMNDYERYEYATFPDGDRVGAAYWVIRCLANPKCEGSAEVLEAIAKRREEVAHA
jgi:hypothetical protein